MTRATAVLVSVLVAAVCATSIAVAVIVTQDRTTPTEIEPALTTLPPDDAATDGCETLIAASDRLVARDDAAAADVAKRELYDTSVRHLAMTLLDLDAVISECAPDVGDAARALRQLQMDLFMEVRAACREGGLDYC